MARIGFFCQVKIAEHLNVDDADAVACFARFFSWKAPIVVDVNASLTHACSTNVSSSDFVSDLKAVMHLVKKNVSARAVEQAMLFAVRRNHQGLVKALHKLAPRRTDFRNAFVVAAKAGGLATLKELLPHVKDTVESMYVLSARTFGTSALWHAAGKGDIEVVKILLPFSDPEKGCSKALRSAAENGHVDVVKVLLPLSDPKAASPSALRLAAENDHVEVVKVLLPFSDPKARSSCALRHAAENGSVEVVKVLLPLSDPRVWSSPALWSAAKRGHAEVVKALIPFADMKACTSSALRNAAKNGHVEVVKVLLPFSDTKECLHAMRVAADKGHDEVVRVLLPFTDPKRLHA